jgi:hypothetical protein
VAFGFGHRQPAGGQGHAGHCGACQCGGGAVAGVQPVLRDQRVDPRALRGRHVGDDGSGWASSELAGVDSGDFAQAAQVRAGVGVGDAPGRQRQGQVPAPVIALAQP